jgi:hypothetical protein
MDEKKEPEMEYDIYPHPKMAEKKKDLGCWLEEYKSCGCSFVAKRKRDLLGYCERHGTDRKRVIKLPHPMECGYAGNG